MIRTKKKIDIQPNLTEVDRVLRNHLRNYMEQKDWNKTALAWHIGLSESNVYRVFNIGGLNFDLKELAYIAAKTDSKLVIGFEPINTEIEK